MSTLHTVFEQDIHKVFLNRNDFAVLRTVRFQYADGEPFEFRDIPVVLGEVEETAREQSVNDHAQGLYRASVVLHCARSDLDGHTPEKGQRISINDQEGGEGFFQEYYVTASACDMGMLRVELEAIDE